MPLKKLELQNNRVYYRIYKFKSTRIFWQLILGIVMKMSPREDPKESLFIKSCMSYFYDCKNNNFRMKRCNIF